MHSSVREMEMGGGGEVIEVFFNTVYADMYLAKRNRATVEMRL